MRRAFGGLAVPEVAQPLDVSQRAIRVDGVGLRPRRNVNAEVRHGSVVLDRNRGSRGLW